MGDDACYRGRQDADIVLLPDGREIGARTFQVCQNALDLVRFQERTDRLVRIVLGVERDGDKADIGGIFAEQASGLVKALGNEGALVGTVRIKEGQRDNMSLLVT